MRTHAKFMQPDRSAQQAYLPILEYSIAGIGRNFKQIGDFYKLDTMVFTYPDGLKKRKGQNISCPALLFDKVNF